MAHEKADMEELDRELVMRFQEIAEVEAVITAAEERERRMAGASRNLGERFPIMRTVR